MVIDGGTDHESAGDMLVVHNEDGTVASGTLANETIAVKDGERLQGFENGRAPSLTAAWSRVGPPARPLP